MIPRLRPALDFIDLKAALPGGGDETSAFERAFARAVGARFAVAYPYGRSALYALLKISGRPGDRVVLPAFTCVVVANAVVKAGFEPVFVDCATNDFNMDLDQAAEAVEAGARFVIATNQFGHPLNMDKLIAGCAEKAIIIQDACLALGSTHHDLPVGSFGRAAFYSFNIGKQLCTLQGGAATTDDEQLYNELKCRQRSELKITPTWRRLWWLTYLAASIIAFRKPFFNLVHRLDSQTDFLSGISVYYQPNRIDLPMDFEFALTPVQTKTGLRQLTKLDWIISKRKDIANRYDRALGGIDDLIRPRLDTEASYSHYTIRVPNRERFQRGMLAQGIETGSLFDYSIPNLPAYNKYSGAFPEAERLAGEVVNLPNYPHLRPSDVDKITEAAKIAIQIC